MPSCITDAHFFDGKRIRTIEGIAQRNAEGEISPSPVQEVFLDHVLRSIGTGSAHRGRKSRPPVDYWSGRRIDGHLIKVPRS